MHFYHCKPILCELRDPVLIQPELKLAVKLMTSSNVKPHYSRPRLRKTEDERFHKEEIVNLYE